MNRIEICKEIIQSIKDYITTPEFLEAHRDPKHFIRNRSLSMLHVISFLFYSSKASMPQNIANIREDLAPLDFPAVSKQAVSKARQFINFSLFRELFNISVEQFYSDIPERKTWHGYHLFAVDGSKIELPNSESNFDFFGKMFTIPDSNGHKKYYTQGLASIIYDVLEDYIVHASLHPYLASERAAAKEHLNNLEELNIYDDSVVIFDRGYYSDKLFSHCVAHDHFCVMRLKEKLNISRKALEKGDLITTIDIGDKKAPESIKIRVICVQLPDGSNEFLATNIFDKSITPEMFRELYFCRWPIEIKYKELKSRFQLEEFNGATKNSVYQEFYINVLMANIASLIKNQADEALQNTNGASNTNKYQANRTYVIGRVKKNLIKILLEMKTIHTIDSIYDKVLKVKSQLQPDRKCTRNKSKRNKRTHFRNMKSAF